MRLACEATLNIAKRPEILEKMRDAYFVTVFCGIETPDPDALKAMHKDHNMMVPILRGSRPSTATGWRSSPASSWGSTPTSPRPAGVARLCR
jgi:hypothetical protein